MGEPGWVEVQAPAVTLRGLSWEPRDAAAGAPIALCLHGFPDTAHGWRLLAPRLAAAGWRVVAPFMRGYAPSTLAAHGSYHAVARVLAAPRPRITAVAARPAARAGAAQLVHDVLPTALAARAVQVVDPAAAVAAVVAGVRRERGPAPRRRGDRVAAELAGGAGPVPGDRAAR